MAQARLAALQYARSVLGRSDTVILALQPSRRSAETWWCECRSETLAIGDPRHLHPFDGRWSMLVMDGEVVEDDLPPIQIPANSAVV
jgi:hypothetical protein